MKRILLSLLIISVLVIGLVACAQSAPAPAPAPTVTVTAPAPAPAPAPTVTVTAPAPPPPLPTVNWQGLTTFNNPQDSQAIPFWKLAENVKARTNGKFTINMTIENQLGIVRDGFAKALSTNVAQIGQMAAGFAETTWSYQGIFNLPYLVNNEAQAAKLQAAVRPISVREYGSKNISVISDYVWVAQEMFVKQQVADVTKLNGLKIRGWTALMLDWLKVAGGVPVSMPSIEVYTALQRGVIDGAITGIATANSGSWAEVAPWAYQIHFIFVIADLVVNKDAFNALPKEYQDILLDEGKIFRQNFDTSLVKENATAWETWKSKGGKVVEVPPAQFDVMKSQALPLWDTWTGKAGPVGQEALAAAKTALGIK